MNQLSFLGQLFTGGNPIKAIGDAIHENITTDKERLELQNEGKRAEYDFRIKEDELDNAAAAGQLEVAKIEAASPRFFIAGARPALLWVCVMKLALLAFQDQLVWLNGILNTLAHVAIPNPPPPDMDQILKLWLPITMVLIGARAWDKTRGTDTKGFK